MSFLLRKVEDATTISKPQSFTSVRIKEQTKKTEPWESEFQTKLLHYFFLSNNENNLHRTFTYETVRTQTLMHNIVQNKIYQSYMVCVRFFLWSSVNITLLWSGLFLSAWPEFLRERRFFWRYNIGLSQWGPTLKLMSRRGNSRQIWILMSSCGSQITLFRQSMGSYICMLSGLPFLNRYRCE